LPSSFLICAGQRVRCGRRVGCGWVDWCILARGFS
jgi:hypothetical protein